MKKSDPRIVIVSCVLFVLFFVYKPWISEVSPLVALSSISRLLAANSNRSDQAIAHSPLPSPINCYPSYGSCNLCSITSPTVLDPKTATFYVVGPTENFTKAQNKEVTLIAGPAGPPCTAQHTAPALLFSATGILCSGNFFHAFNDALIPLFITVNSVFTGDQDPILVVSSSCDWWVQKYTNLLQSFSKHPIITLNNDTATHCFPSAIVGLVCHGFMTIEPRLMPNSKTLLHFHALLEKTYGQNHSPPPTSLSPISTSLKPRPRLLLASRSGGNGRAISNQAELRKAAEEEGFDVTEFEPKVETPLSETYELVSTSHAIIGVHGAALAHLLFLRPGSSVVMQVVPVGLEWVSEACFGTPAREMGLEYMEYKIGVEESSLGEKYGKDDLVIKDPMRLQKNGWSIEVMDIYLKQQNVKLDMVRFRKYLKKAYEKASASMEKEG